MRFFALALSVFLFISCSSSSDEEKNAHQPTSPQVFPETEYENVLRLAQRRGEMEMLRLVGWDEEFYYFDFSQPKKAINQGAAKVSRPVFAKANGGALTLQKGVLTSRNGQVRNVNFVD